MTLIVEPFCEVMTSMFAQLAAAAPGNASSPNRHPHVPSVKLFSQQSATLGVSAPGCDRQQ
jgi:hypothetical protein